MFAAVDSWIFVLLLAMAALLRLLSSKAGASKSSPSTENESTFPKPDTEQRPQHAPSSSEDQIRKFLEALGQPATSKPPPPIVPRSHLPPRPTAPVQPPRPLFPKPKLRPRESRPKMESFPGEAVEPRQVIQPTIEAAKIAFPGSSTPVFEIREATTAVVEPGGGAATAVGGEGAYAIPAVQTTQTRATLKMLLQSSAGVRTAIMLREILGSPRGLQPLEEMAGIV